MKYEECRWCLEHVAAINFWANLGLAAFKIFCGIYGDSKAVLADAAHSAADIVLALFLWVIMKYSNRSADEKYPYGYGHAEFIGASFFGIFIILVAVFICSSSIMAMLRGELLMPKLVAIMCSIVSIVANELLFRYTLCIGREANSPVAVANAWENRADVYSSTAALIGVVGARLGFRIMDPIAAVAIGIIVARVGIRVFYDSTKGLMHSCVDKETANALRDAASRTNGIERIGSLNAGQSGQKILVDIGASVDPSLSVSQGKLLMEKIRENIRERCKNVGEVLVHLSAR